MANMDNSRTKNAIRNIFYGFIQRIVMLLLPFVVRSVMIYRMGSLYVGLNGLFTSVLQVLSLAELGFGEAMVYNMYKPMAEHDVKKVNALLGLYRKIYTIIGIAVLGLGLALLPFLDYFISGETPEGISIQILFLIYLANSVLSYFLYAYKSSLFVASQRSDIKNNITTVTNVIMYVLQILVILTTQNYYLYIILIVFGTVLNNLLVQVRSLRAFPEYRCEGNVDKSTVKDIKENVGGLFIYKVCAVFRNSFDSIIISAFLGLTILAQYQNYYYILSSITAFMTVITGSITAGVGNSISVDSKDKNYKDFKKFQYLYMFITSVCTICFLCLYQPFMKIWVGEELMFDDSIMLIFCLYFFTSQMGNICYVYRQAAGLWWQDRFRPIVEAIANLAINIILVNLIGVSGVLLSTVLCLIFINCFWGSRTLYKYYFSEYKMKEYLINIVLYAIITLVAGGIAYWICSLITVGSVLKLVLNCAICVLIAPLLVYLGTFGMSERKEAIKFVTEKVLKRK